LSKKNFGALVKKNFRTRSSKFSNSNLEKFKKHIPNFFQGKIIWKTHSKIFNQGQKWKHEGRTEIRKWEEKNYR
jgi:hypothetical protein